MIVMLAFGFKANAQCPTPTGLTATWSTPSTNVVVSWTENGSATLWQVEYKILGASQGNYVSATSNPITIYNLDSTSNYQFRVRAICSGSEQSSWSSKVSLCPTSTYINYSNLASPYCWCYYGTFSNPYEINYIINYGPNGPNSNQSRHTVHFSPTETDPRTNNQLHTVYPGACNSVRLGNWSTGSEAEAIKYRLIVDTTKFGILLLNYAAVMQDPSHSSTQQPRFKIEILNAQNQPLDDCGQRDFIANSSLGWNTVGSGSSSVLWKDWTTVGLDISQYHGQSIFIRLTTYDCSLGAHYGYAYFTLACVKKTIQIAGCGTGTKTMTAPNGFNYEWYSTSAPGTILSTNQSYTVITDGSSYICKCTSTEYENCYFNLEATAEPRYPKSDFNYTYTISDGCNYNVNFENTSYVSSSLTDSIPTGDLNDSYEWTFSHYGMPDTVSMDINPTIVMKPGLNTIKLKSTLAECVDSIERTIILPMLYADTSFIYDSICQGFEYDKYGFTLDSTQTVGGIVLDTIHMISAHGCDSTSILNLTIRHAPAPQHLYGEVTMTVAEDLISGQYVFSIDPVPGVNLVSGPEGYEWVLHNATWYMYPNPILSCTILANSVNKNAQLEIIAHSECGAASLIRNVTASPYGVEETLSSSLTLQPNPTTGNLNIHSSEISGKIKITVYNSSFIKIDEVETYIDSNSNMTYSFNSDRPNGIYFFCIEDDSNRVFKKIVLLR